MGKSRNKAIKKKLVNTDRPGFKFSQNIEAGVSFLKTVWGKRKEQKEKENKKTQTGPQSTVQRGERGRGWSVGPSLCPHTLQSSADHTNAK